MVTGDFLAEPASPGYSTGRQADRPSGGGPGCVVTRSSHDSDPPPRSVRPSTADTYREVNMQRIAILLLLVLLGVTVAAPVAHADSSYLWPAPDGLSVVATYQLGTIT